MVVFFFAEKIPISPPRQCRSFCAIVIKERSSEYNADRAGLNKGHAMKCDLTFVYRYQDGSVKRTLFKENYELTDADIETMPVLAFEYRDIYNEIAAEYGWPLLDGFSIHLETIDEEEE